MPKVNQSVRINQLAEVVCQGLLHLKTMIAMLVEGSEPIQDHVQRLADVAQQMTDPQAQRFDFSLDPGEEVIS